MIHPATCLTLLSLVALRGLVPIPHLLHLLVLHRSVRGDLLGVVVGIVTNLPTLVAVLTHGDMRCTGPHRRANQSHQMVLLVCKARSLQPWALERLGGALKLLMMLWLVLVLLLLMLLAITPSWASWTE
jgi:hypothetical protein